MSYSPLECKDYVKFLDIIIDKNLNWKVHIDLIALKISKTVGMVAKLRHLVSLVPLLILLLSSYISLLFSLTSSMELAREVKRHSQHWISFFSFTRGLYG